MSSYASEAFASIGIPPAQDFSSGDLMGAQYTPLTVSSPNEERSSSESSFLQAAKDRPNLKVYTQTLAKRILFDKTKKATGVLLSAGNGIFQLMARREVILSAGAVNHLIQAVPSYTKHSIVPIASTTHGERHRPESYTREIQYPNYSNPRRCRPAHVGSSLSFNLSASQRRNTKRAI